MAQEYRYPLTRVCLRGGAMTLPRTMIGLFPSDGSVVIVDTLTGTEHSVHMSHPRVVSGLGPLFREHGLEVNDELVIVPLGGIRFSVTPVLRSTAHAVQGVADEPAGVHAELDAATHVTEAPEQTEGAEDSQRADAYALDNADANAEDGSVDEQVVVHALEANDVDTDDPETEADATTSQAAAPQAAPASGLDPRLAVREAESALAELESQRAQALKGSEAAGAESSQGTLWGDNDTNQNAGSTNAENSSGQTAHGDAQRVEESSSNNLRAAADVSDSTDIHDTPTEQPAAQASQPREAERRGAAFEEEDHNDATLAAVALTSRVRRVFSPLGFRIEPLAAGVAYLHAEMGRRRYKVLVQTLRSGERLDWAGLLSRRRNSPANYLAVMGDRADLTRLSNPANLARATLWSWEALGRLEEMHGSVPVTPLDLESHFERDGLFEQGLKRFEQGIAARIAERGAASEVLTRLARLKAPAVFLLEELAQDVSLSREAVLRILDRFAEAPMNLVARVDSGEFLLRQPVDAALASLAAYAESLRQRLPNSRREVITGLDDDNDTSPESQLLDDNTEANPST